MPTPKLTPQKLEEIKRRQQLHVSRDTTFFIINFCLKYQGHFLEACNSAFLQHS
ncbi:MAG: hypothetical protein MRERV_21c001, partial [Mycoplasmataceae bacterium RV_VA103A]